MYKIEKATATDIEELVQIQKAAFEPDRQACGDGPPGYDCCEHQLAALNRYSYYAIKYSDEIIGGFYFELDSSRLHLIRLFVDPPYQGSGTGKAALRFLSEVIGNTGVIELETPTFNQQSQSFYERNSFQRVKTIHYEGGDSYLYRRNASTFPPI